MTLEADHYNYIRKDEEAVIHAQTAQEFISPEEEAKIREHHPQNADQIIAEIKAARMDWNLRVSDFVAELIAVNKDGQEAVELLLHSDSRVDFNAVDNIFEVNVL